MDKIPVSFNEITVGMELKDDNEHKCIVQKITNNQNIIVKYTWGTVGGYGFLCLDPSCKEYDIVFKL